MNSDAAARSSRITLPSALPARRAMAFFITFPRSFGPVAPSSLMTAATSAAISSGLSCGGKKERRKLSSSSSRLASSGRPALVYSAMASRRCFTCVLRVACSSASGSGRFTSTFGSGWQFFTSRKVDSRHRLLGFDGLFEGLIQPLVREALIPLNFTQLLQSPLFGRRFFFFRLMLGFS